MSGPKCLLSLYKNYHSCFQLLTSFVSQKYNAIRITWYLFHQRLSRCQFMGKKCVFSGYSPTVLFIDECKRQLEMCNIQRLKKRLTDHLHTKVTIWLVFIKHVTLHLCKLNLCWEQKQFIIKWFLLLCDSVCLCIVVFLCSPQVFDKTWESVSSTVLWCHWKYPAEATPPSQQGSVLFLFVPSLFPLYSLNSLINECLWP